MRGSLTGFLLVAFALAFAVVGGMSASTHNHHPLRAGKVVAEQPVINHPHFKRSADLDPHRAPVNGNGNGILFAYPALVATSVGNITITWSGFSSLSCTAVVAIFVPSTNPVPVGWVNISTTTDACKSPDDVITWSSSSSSVGAAGSIVVPLVHTRTPYLFRLVNVLPAIQLPIDMSTVIAESNLVQFDPTLPHQIRLSLTDTDGEMRVMFTTQADLDVSNPPMVQFGLASQGLDLNESATGSSYTYNRTVMCEWPANDPAYWMDPGYQNDVLLTGLVPGQKYLYRVGSRNGTWSDIRSFVHAPVVSATTNTQFIAYGDLGVHVPFQVYQEQQWPASKTVHWMTELLNDRAQRRQTTELQSTGSTGSSKHASTASEDPMMILHIGDISYARGYMFLWDFFMSAIEPLASQVPYMVGIGNHEYDYSKQAWRPDWAGYGQDSGGECGIPYQTRFHMPAPGQTEDPLTRNLWYSYDFGNVHFTVMSTEHNFLPGSPQYNWIVSDLAGVDRSRTPWLIFSGHRPMYSSSEDDNPAGMKGHMMNAIEPLLLKYRVNLALWGHVHSYERTCGIIGNFQCGQRDEDGVVHMTIGMAGNDYQVPWQPMQKNDYHRLTPDWIVFRAMDFGYVTFSTTATHMHVEYFDDQRDQVHDVLDLGLN